MTVSSDSSLALKRQLIYTPKLAMAVCEGVLVNDTKLDQGPLIFSFDYIDETGVRYTYVEKTPSSLNGIRGYLDDNGFSYPADFGDRLFGINEIPCIELSQSAIIITSSKSGEALTTGGQRRYKHQNTFRSFNEVMHQVQEERFGIPA